MKNRKQILASLNGEQLIQACAIVYNEVKPNMKHIREITGAPKFATLEAVCLHEFFDDLRSGAAKNMVQAFFDVAKEWEQRIKDARKAGEPAPDEEAIPVYALSAVVGAYAILCEKDWKASNKAGV